MLRLLLCLLSLVLSTEIFASKTLVIHENANKVWLNNYLEFLVDTLNALNLESAKTSADWQVSEAKSLNFEDAQVTVWLKLSVDNRTAKEVYLEFKYPIIDTIEYFIIQADSLHSAGLFGSHFPFEKRSLKTTLPTLKLPKGVSTVYAKTYSNLNLQLPLAVYSEEKLLSKNTQTNYLQGLYTGILVLAILYALIIGFVTRDIIFHSYIGHVIGTGFITLHLGGYAFQFIWPNYPAFNYYEPWIFGMGIFSTLFAMAFLDTAKRAPKLNTLLWISLSANFLVYPLTFFGFIVLANKLVQIVGLLGCMLMLIVGIIMLKRGFKEARFFVLAWSVFLVGVIITILERISVLPFNSFTLHASQIGSGIDVILLSVALADRINIIRVERKEAQKKALSTAEQNRLLIENQNALLEIKVKERTAELEKLNEQKAKVFSIIGHDLVGPMAIMDQALEILIQDKEARSTEMLSNLKENTTNAHRLLENLMLWGRSNAKEKELDISEFNVQELIDEISGLTRLTAESKQINVLFSIPPDMSIQTDKRLLSTILRNLLSNALKFTPTLGEISVTAKQDEEWIYLAVSDSGVGMTQQKIEEILNSSALSTKGTSGEKGTGLGLRLCVEFCQKLNSKLSIQSEPTKGTSIEIMMPKRFD